MHTMGKGIVATAALVVLLGGCGDAGATKAGHAPQVVTLRLGTADRAGRLSEPQIVAFAGHVAALSDGTIEIEPVYQAGGDGEVDAPGPDHVDWDQTVAGMVQDGELDLGLIPTRAWDTMGVTTMRALNAPFLVDSSAFLQAVVTSDLAGDLLAGLDDAGVVGLAVLPESLRHVFVFGAGADRVADWSGMVIRAPHSATSYDLFTALGASADDVNGPAFPDGVADGTIDAAESDLALGAGLPAPSVVAANVTPFPKANALVVGADVFDGLTDEQRAVLREAAGATLTSSVAEMWTEAEAAASFCSNGGTIVNASDAELDALRQAAQPVYDELEMDETTAALIAGIRDIGATVPPAPTIEPCGPAPAEAPSTSQAAAVDLEGIWRQDVTMEALTSHGVSAAVAAQESGVTTYYMDDGTVVMDFQDHHCVGTYEIEGDRVTFHWHTDCYGSQAMTAAVDGDTVTWTDAIALPPVDTAEDQALVEGLASVPWFRVGDVESSHESTDAPDAALDIIGTWRQDVSVEDLVAFGVSGAYAEQEAGVQTLTIADDGTFTVDYQAIHCAGTYEVEGNVVTMRATNGCHFATRQTGVREGDTITWADAESLPPYDNPEDQAITEGFASVPWVLVE